MTTPHLASVTVDSNIYNMDNEQIKETIEHFKEEGDDIRVRDIAYAFLSRMFADRKTAYQCLFSAEGYDDYVNSDTREKLDDYLKSEGFVRSFSTDADTGGITFEENRREMEQMLKDAQRAKDDGLMEAKDFFNIQTKIRIALNDKFKVEAAQKDRMIIVEKKFDFVCPHTRRECYQLDKEDAMKRWNLIENPNTDGND